MRGDGVDGHRDLRPMSLCRCIYLSSDRDEHLPRDQVAA